ncbi:MAG: hypothetical protein COA97_05860 [Flavobacteriales bacterium]|nr:MAG: hypothetical protein COA97_05860 [Flavobacteriales bacterium]
MKKIIYITLVLIIFSSSTASSQFWKKNKKETEQIVDKKESPSKPASPEVKSNDETENVVQAQEPQSTSTGAQKNSVELKAGKPKKKKSNFKPKKNITQPELDSGTIEQQFDYIITKSSSFKQFQLIRRASILKVKAHTLDSIKMIRKELITANKSVAQTKSSINQLENEVQLLKKENESISEEVDSISLFGSLMSKTKYNTIVWGLIVVLLLGLIYFIAQFKKGCLVTTSAKNNLDKIEYEFEAFRKKSLKKEQETMRKLQDEINKNVH